MNHEPYDYEADQQFDAIVDPYRNPTPHRHPGGRTMQQPQRSGRDQMMILLGCGGLTLMIAIAAAVVIIAWRW